MVDLLILISKGLPLDQIKESNPGRYYKLTEVAKEVDQYWIYKNAIDLGLTFNASDFSLETLRSFTFVKDCLEEVRGKLGGKSG